MTSWILRNVLSREVDVLLPVYKSMLRPHIEYCVQVWAPRPRYDNWQSIMELENCQRKFTKLIRGMENLSYKDRLIKLGVTTILERRSRDDLIEMFKIQNKMVCYGQNMFRNGKSGRQLLLMPGINITPYHHLFKCRSLKYWNRLPLKIRTTSSVINFKILLEQHKNNSIRQGINNGYCELSDEIFKRL